MIYCSGVSRAPNESGEIVDYFQEYSGPRSAIGSASNSRARGSGFDTRSGHILSFFLPLFQEGQLSVTGESMCTKYWLTASEV